MRDPYAPPGTEEKDSDKIPQLPRGVFCILKSSGEKFICSIKPDYPDVVLIGGKRTIMDGLGQIKERVKDVWPVTKEFFDEMYELDQ